MSDENCQGMSTEVNNQSELNNKRSKARKLKKTVTHREKELLIFLVRREPLLWKEHNKLHFKTKKILGAWARVAQHMVYFNGTVI